MNATAELGRNPVSKHQIQPKYGDEQAAAGRDCRNRIAKPNSQARTRTGNIYFPCSADLEQDWKPYPVDPFFFYTCDQTMHTKPESLEDTPMTRRGNIGTGSTTRWSNLKFWRMRATWLRTAFRTQIRGTNLFYKPRLGWTLKQHKSPLAIS